jgi:glycosyltransferase involved in cell wall biosynthesis
MYKRRAHSADSLYERLSYRFQSFLYKKFEGKFCRKYDLVVTVSKTDEEWVKKYYRPNNLITVPIPVDSEYFHPLVAEEPVENLIVFTGMMNHPPNSDAAGFFARHIYPVVKAAIPSAKFNIVGRNPTEDVRILGKIDGVKVTGFVPDIRPYIAQANIIVVPLRFGAGMRQKILEAWAMEKCVVSTRIGAEGLDYEDNKNILIADDAETMARKIIYALQNPGKVEQIAKMGRDTVVKQHNPDMLAKNYFDAVESVINEKFATNKPLRVLIDLRWMVPGIAGGIENLSRSFINCLLEIDKYNKYSILLPTVVKHDFELRKNNNFHLIQSDGLVSTFKKISYLGACLIHSRLKIPYWRSHEIETLTHSKAYNADIALSMPGYIHPELHTMTNVLVVPDIQHEFCPEFFSKQELENRKRLYTESIHIADHLCAISEFTRQTLIEVLDVSAERITTTHLAADPIFHADSIYRGIYGEVLPKYKLEPGQYLLFPGNTWLHKNHLKTLEALLILREDYHLEPQLVCTGTLKDAQPEIMNLVKRYGLERQVNFLGYCPSIDMPSLYEGAFGMIFPSIFEGFGIPLLEAMWCSCPIACSNVTSLPEIAGDAAIMFDPHSTEAIAHAFNRLLTESETRKELVKKGLEQAKKFSWMKFTTEVTRILHDVYTENKPLERKCT